MWTSAAGRSVCVRTVVVSTRRDLTAVIVKLATSRRLLNRAVSVCIHHHYYDCYYYCYYYYYYHHHHHHHYYDYYYDY